MLQVWDITLSMLADKAFKAKAAEIRGLMLFVQYLFDKYKESLQDSTKDVQSARCFTYLISALDEAKTLDETMNSCGRCVGSLTAHKMFDSYQAFINLLDRAGVPLTPKCHLSIHMFQKVYKKGNPRFYSTYRDESYNGVIGRIASSVHQSVFPRAVLKKIHIMERLALNQAIEKAIAERGDHFFTRYGAG